MIQVFLDGRGEQGGPLEGDGRGDQLRDDAARPRLEAAGAGRGQAGQASVEQGGAKKPKKCYKIEK